MFSKLIIWTVLTSILSSIWFLSLLCRIGWSERLDKQCTTYYTNICYSPWFRGMSSSFFCHSLLPVSSLYALENDWMILFRAGVVLFMKHICLLSQSLMSLGDDEVALLLGGSQRHHKRDSCLKNPISSYNRGTLPSAWSQGRALANPGVHNYLYAHFSSNNL